MSDCAKYRHLLPYSERNEGDGDLFSALRNHLADCRRCRVENNEMKEVIELGRSLFRRQQQLPAGVRNQIARTAAERAARGGGWAALLVRPMLWTRRPGFATALAAALLVAVVALPIAFKGGLAPTTFGPERSEVRIVGITADPDDGVRLVWSNGNGGFYKVSKSRDPRGLEGAEAHVVHGNEWVDTEADSAQVVYYRIEPLRHD